MKVPWYRWDLQQIYTGRPSIGWLMDLCEENYRLVEQLSPGIRQLQGRYLSSLDGAMDLYLEVLEQTPYTSLIHLTYFFAHEDGQQPDPDATLRIYYDSRQIEVLDLRQQALPLKSHTHWPTLEQKWKANLFVSKWLAYCVREGHGFHRHNALCESISC